MMTVLDAEGIRLTDLNSDVIRCVCTGDCVSWYARNSLDSFKFLIVMK